MNGEHPSLENLHRHFDGELSGPELGALQKHVQSCDVCQAELDSLDRISDMVRFSTNHTAAALDADFSRMFANIEREIAQPSALPSLESANVISMTAPKSKLGRKRSRFIEQVVPALGTLALAASALLTWTQRSSFEEVNQRLASTAASLSEKTKEFDSSKQHLDEREQEVAALGSILDQMPVQAVRFGLNAGQVFTVPIDEHAFSTVVWIDDWDDPDDEEVEGG
jgi:anti-sigma factor RsiW